MTFITSPSSRLFIITLIILINRQSVPLPLPRSPLLTNHFFVVNVSTLNFINCMKYASMQHVLQVDEGPGLW